MEDINLSESFDICLTPFLNSNNIPQIIFDAKYNYTKETLLLLYGKNINNIDLTNNQIINIFEINDSVMTKKINNLFYKNQYKLVILHSHEYSNKINEIILIFDLILNEIQVFNWSGDILENSGYFLNTSINDLEEFNIFELSNRSLFTFRDFHRIYRKGNKIKSFNCKKILYSLLEKNFEEENYVIDNIEIYD